MIRQDSRCIQKSRSKGHWCIDCYSGKCFWCHFKFWALIVFVAGLAGVWLMQKSWKELGVCQFLLHQWSRHKPFHDLIKVMKNLTRSCAAGKYLPPDIVRTFLDGRCGQGIKGIMQNISKPKMTLKTFYISFLFKPIECIDTICIVQFLHYKSMMGILCFKPSSFCVNETSLYSSQCSRDIHKTHLPWGQYFSQ